MHNRGITSLVRYCWPLAVVALVAGAGCNTGSRDPEPFNAKKSTAAPSLPGGGQQTGTLVADVRVDTNRDGVISPDDENGEDTWNAAGGAVFLHNNDDDDLDGNRDKLDNVINGAQDQADMASIVLKQASGLGVLHTVLVNITPVAARGSVRVFDSNGAEVFAPRDKNFAPPATSLAAGDLTYYLESTSEITPQWDGNLTITVTILSAGNPISQDVVAMRCSPVIFPDNTRPAIRVSLMNIMNPQGAPNQGFFQPVNTRTPSPVTINAVDETTYQWDRWVQDNMQQGYQSMPGQGGTEFRQVIQQLERGGGLGNLTYAMAGPDTGWDYPGGPGSSHNYGGNLEVTPPYTGFPFGQLLSGGGTAGTLTGQAITEHMSQEQIDYMDAQGMQGPTQELSSEWLAVGHIDEYFQFLPDGNGSWKLYIASPDLARQNLQTFAGQGGGGATVFAGRQSQTTVNGILNDPALLTFNQAAQVRIDGAEAKLVTLMSLQASQIVYLPVLFEQVTAQGHGIALNPGVQNLLCVTSATGPNVLFVPDPEGPDDSSGADIWQTQIRQAFGPNNTLEFVDVFESYHELMGEAHCGSNVERAPYTNDWWN